MKKQRVGVDVDEVLLDLTGPLMEHRKELYGLDPEVLTIWDITDTIPSSEREHFWSTFAEKYQDHTQLQPCVGAQEGIRQLREVAEVYIVSAHLQHAERWVAGRDRWLAEHYGFDRRHVVYTHAKHVFDGAMLIDDKWANVHAWQEEHLLGRGVLWAIPGNRHHQHQYRTADWAQCIAWLKELPRW